MIFLKLDYVIEAEQAREREAAMCAAYAKPRDDSAAAGELWTKLTGALKGAAREYFAHQGWKAHEGVFAQAPMAAQAAGVGFAPARRVDHVRELKRLAGVRLSPREAEVVWARLLEHKWYLGERLGRDVGMRVAAADFFENVEPPRVRVKARRAWEPLPRLPMMMPFGERG